MGGGEGLEWKDSRWQKLKCVALEQQFQCGDGVRVQSYFTLRSVSGAAFWKKQYFSQVPTAAERTEHGLGVEGCSRNK